MRQILDSEVAQTVTSNNYLLPSSVDIMCPHCKRLVTFNLKWSSLNKNLVYTLSRCAGCGDISYFIIVDFKEINEQKVLKGSLFVYPEADRRKAIEGINEVEDFSDGLHRAYESTINVYNTREWTATAVLCRRLLEGITKTLLPSEEHDKPLAKQLEILPNKTDLHRPIMTLAHAIRKGGNLGAHFDLEKEPNEETTKLMVDLIDYLIEYLFILPQRIEELNNYVEKMPKD
jgi:hypothetical protein